MRGNNREIPPNVQQEEMMNMPHPHLNSEGNLGRNASYNRQNPSHTVENNGEIPPNFHYERNRDFPPSPPLHKDPGGKDI